MKGFKLFILALTFIGVVFTQNALADRDANAEERAKVVEALTAAGCPNVGEVEVEGNYFEADDVICDDGKKYEIYLDQDMKIIKKKLDD
ncbi:MAG: hypothetical protein DHS20C13_02330 [Thermodesulfobacteriota bacterium]|nr:MAG: hypothetical protein DHS20C13_02330 [Thermodesulfobacteriota bacterium]